MISAEIRIIVIPNRYTNFILH